mgnify:CR=1 FL=1
MTPERIAEFRDAIANHPHFGIGGDALSKILDALEAAQAEIAVDAGRLRDAAMLVWGEDAHGCDTPDRLADAILGLRAQIADLKRGGVVVPELLAETTLALIAIDWPNRTIDIIATARNIREWFRNSARTIPADRVLGDGMVAVDATRLEALESIAAKIEALALGQDGRAWTPLHYREFARNALRAQPTQEPTT